MTERVYDCLGYVSGADVAYGFLEPGRNIFENL